MATGSEHYPPHQKDNPGTRHIHPPSQPTRWRLKVVIPISITFYFCPSQTVQHNTEPESSGWSEYETYIGPPRVVNLKDNSTATLNSDSKIRVHFSDEERYIE